MSHVRFAYILLGNAVDIASRGQPSADVNELADTRLFGEKAYRPAEELPVIPRGHAGVGYGLEQFPSRFLVNLKVVLAAQQIVIYAGNIRRVRPLQSLKGQGLSSTVVRVRG